MVTAEAAVVLPVLVVVALLATAGVEAGAAQVRCLQAAALAARLTARSEPADAVRRSVAAAAPAEATSTVLVGADTVTASVTVQVRVALIGRLLPAFTVSESAVAPLEPAP